MIGQTVRFAMAVFRSKVDSESGCTRNHLPNALVDDVMISILRHSVIGVTKLEIPTEGSGTAFEKVCLPSSDTGGINMSVLHINAHEYFFR